MNWTRKTPTKPGWYWFKDDNCTEIMRVAKKGHSNALKAYRFVDGRPISAVYYQGCWMGPIEVPEGPGGEERDALDN